MRTVMAQINRSAGIPDQARMAVTRMAQLEAMRQTHLIRGQTNAAGRTLEGMAETFAAAPSLEELQAVMANYFANGGTISGREAAMRGQLGLGSTYSAASNTPAATADWIKRNHLEARASEVVPVALAPFVQSGVQAGAYYYATAKQRYVGAGLAAIVELSTAEKARNLHVANVKAMYLKSVAALSGLGADTEGAMESEKLAAQAELCRRFPNSKDCTPPAGAGAPGGDFLGELQKFANNPMALDWAANAALTGWWWANPSADEVNSFFCMIPPDIRSKNEVKKHFVNLMKAGPTFGQPDKRKGAALDVNCSGIKYNTGTSSSSSSTSSGGRSWQFRKEYVNQLKKDAPKAEAGGDNTMLIVGGVAAVAVIALLMRK